MKNLDFIVYIYEIYELRHQKYPIWVPISINMIFWKVYNLKKLYLNYKIWNFYKNEYTIIICPLFPIFALFKYYTLYNFDFFFKGKISVLLDNNWYMQNVLYTHLCYMQNVLGYLYSYNLKLSNEIKIKEIGNVDLSDVTSRS